MSKKMIAEFSDNAFEALSCGEAVDNNGFRSKEGYFYPDQPTFSPFADEEEMLESSDAMEEISAEEVLQTIRIVSLTVLGIIYCGKVAAPRIKRTINNIKEKKAEKRKKKELEEAQNSPNNNENIINLDDFRHSA